MKVNLLLWNDTVGVLRRARLDYINTISPLDAYQVEVALSQQQRRLYRFTRHKLRQLRADRCQNLQDLYDKKQAQNGLGGKINIYG